ncbi:hypothetical protein [uncultured Proteiniphilum sp.]|uniref:hypothetical protein n=1 Tax=uncultured Proteiniphilum sp. TaxID=497637 RepID=UPI0026025F8A|nr:hypothetical protein [uncultured Proteiniphilum sp.]
MEFGDIIYFILLVFFMILGFFNDSRKKKNQQKQSEAESRPFFNEEQKTTPPQSRDREYKTTPPPVPVTYSGKDVHREFRSSLDLVSIHDKQSSHPGYTFDYDVNSFYEKDPDSIDAPENAGEEKVKRSLHPLLKDLRDDTGREELKKGLIYGEIMQRKY